jgi:hypothetical protein
MEHDQAFNNAIIAFIKGGDGSDLIDAINKLRVSPEEMGRVLKLAGCQGIPESLDADAFLQAFSGILDSVTTHQPPTFSVAPQFEPTTRGDVGMRVRRISEIGMENREPDQPRKSKDSDLNAALRESGWISFHYLCRMVKASAKGRTREALKQVAEENDLRHEIQEFQRGTQNHIRISPTLARAFRDAWPQQPEVEGMQSGERLLTKLDGYQRFAPLFGAIRTELEKRSLSPDLAFPQRKTDRGKVVSCLTADLLNMLLQKGLIRELPQHVHQHVRVVESKIPKNMVDIALKAAEICDGLAPPSSLKSSAEVSPSWQERVRRSSADVCLE